MGWILPVINMAQDCVRKVSQLKDPVLFQSTQGLGTPLLSAVEQKPRQASQSTPDYSRQVTIMVPFSFSNLFFQHLLRIASSLGRSSVDASTFSFKCVGPRYISAVASR